MRRFKLKISIWHQPSSDTVYFIALLQDFSLNIIQRVPLGIGRIYMPHKCNSIFLMHLDLIRKFLELRKRSAVTFASCHMHSVCGARLIWKRIKIYILACAPSVRAEAHLCGLHTQRAAVRGWATLVAVINCNAQRETLRRAQKQRCIVLAQGFLTIKFVVIERQWGQCALQLQTANRCASLPAF